MGSGGHEHIITGGFIMISIPARTAALSSLLLLTGCNTFTRPAKIEPIASEGLYWVHYNSDRRGGIISKGDADIKICSEPAPDTSSNFEAQVTLDKTGIGKADGKGGQHVVILPGRDSTVLTLREALYRLCELSVNRPKISDEKLMNAYDQVIIAVTDAAKAETARKNAQAAQANAVVASLGGIPLAPMVAVPSNASAAKEAERSGFQNLIDGEFAAALADFTRVEALVPGYHNAYEIGNALKNVLQDGQVSDTEKKKLFNRIDSDWEWGAPEDQLQEIRKQAK